MSYKVEFIKSVFSLEELPPPEYPEIAILGRSNAGKSSLINSLFNQKGLARVSSTPGFTQSLNFYLVNRKFYFVDLPGYGFADVPKRVYLNWQILVEGYLKSKRDFRLLFLIFDIRRKPDDLDQTLIKFVRFLEKPYALLLNKIDTLKNHEINKQKELYQKELGLNNEEVFLISCKKRLGFDPLRGYLKKILS